MRNREEKLLAIAALLTEAAETGRPLQSRYAGGAAWIDAWNSPAMSSDLSLWRVAPPPPKKVIDLSVLIESKIDCEFWDNMNGISQYTPGYLDRYMFGDMPYGRSRVAYHRYCQPRMNHDHYWGGKSDKCPVPEGFEIEVEWYDDHRGFGCALIAYQTLRWENIRAFRVLRGADGYCMPWQVATVGSWEIPMIDQEFLEWMYERLVHVHGENPNMGYMQWFKQQIAEIERLKNPRKLTTEELCHLRFSCLPDDLTDAQDMQIMINNLYPKLIQLYAEAES